MTSILHMDTVTIVHPTGAPDVHNFDTRAGAERHVVLCEHRCKVSLGKRTIKRSWAEDIVIEGAKLPKKKKK